MKKIYFWEVIYNYEIKLLYKQFGVEYVLNYCKMRMHIFKIYFVKSHRKSFALKYKFFKSKYKYYLQNNKKYMLADYFSEKNERLMLIEEMAELTQVLCKLYRLEGIGLPLSDKYNEKVLKESLIEEMADVKLVLEQLTYLINGENEMNKISDKKMDRALSNIIQTWYK